MKSNVLISGARAPVCLDLSRQFHRVGYEVDVIDSISFPITRFSNSFNRFHHVASPNFEYQKFASQIKEICGRKDFEMLIPTCEEVFYFAKLKEEIPSLPVFCPPLEVLEKVHNKWTFSALTKKWIIQSPETHLLLAIENWKHLSLSSSEFVFKPAYSRFAAQTLVSPSEEDLRKIRWQDGPWLAQKRVYGKEICVYAVAVHGDLKAFVSYEPVQRVGLGAGIHLKPYFDQRLVNFCREFAKDLSFHGQFAFDFIQDSRTDEYKVLECNPRATSGVHFFDAELVEAFRGKNEEIIFGQRVHPLMIGSAMLFYGLPKSLSIKKWLRFFQDFRKAKDFISDREDFWPTVGQYVSFFGFFLKALFQGKSTHQVSSEDIEYNGNR